MSAWVHLLKARILLFCSLGVVLIGLAPLLYLIGLAAWQIHMQLQTGAWIALPASVPFTDRALLQAGPLAPVLAFIPHMDWPRGTHDVVRHIVSSVHIGAIPGLIGCAVLAVGVSSLLRQRTLIRIHKDRRKAQRLDRQRYASSLADANHDGRREPVIGATDFALAPANDTPAPASPPQSAANTPARSAPERPRACRQTRGRPPRRRAAA